MWHLPGPKLALTLSTRTLTQCTDGAAYCPCGGEAPAVFPCFPFRFGRERCPCSSAPGRRELFSLPLSSFALL